MRDQVLSDAQWSQIEPLMPVPAAGGGRPFSDHRQVVEALIWRYRAGAPWRDLPESFGSWKTAWKRHRRFSEDGTWDAIHAALLRDEDAVGEIDWAVSVDSTVNRAHQHATNLPRVTGGAPPNHKNLRQELPDHGIGRSRGGSTSKIHHLVDGRGLPMVIIVGPGQGGDAPLVPALLAHLSVARVGAGRPRTRPDRLRGDKAYSSRAIREALRRRRIIPQPRDQIGHRLGRGSRGGRPPGFDRDDYRGRNVVERSFCHAKQWRGIATRYDKLSIVDRSDAVYQCLKRLGDTP